MPERDYTLGLG